MTRDELKDVTTEMLDGETLSDTLFNTLLDYAQAFVEGLRPWMALRTTDETQSVGAGTTFQTQLTLPTDFKRWYSRYPINLVDSAGRLQGRLREVPFNERNLYRDDGGKFSVDYRNRKLYILGTHSGTYTVQMHYVYKPTRVSAGASNEWVFDSDYHPLLGILVAIFHRRGISYDVVSARNADELALQARAMLKNMDEEDNALALSGVEGRDFGVGGAGGAFGEGSGNIHNLR